MPPISLPPGGSLRCRPLSSSIPCLHGCCPEVKCDTHVSTEAAAFWGPWSPGGTNRTPKGTVFSGMMRSVDDWPLAKILIQISGGKPRSVTVSFGRRDRLRGLLLLRGVCHRFVVWRGLPPVTIERLRRGPPFEELSGGNWMTQLRTAAPSRGWFECPGRSRRRLVRPGASGPACVD